MRTRPPALRTLPSSNEAAVADLIGGQDGGALGAFFGHLARPFLKNVTQEILCLARTLRASD
jgi:hypothetical protein